MYIAAHFSDLVQSQQEKWRVSTSFMEPNPFS
jgi:hypothetical protein